MLFCVENINSASFVTRVLTVRARKRYFSSTERESLYGVSLLLRHYSSTVMEGLYRFYGDHGQLFGADVWAETDNDLEITDIDIPETAETISSEAPVIGKTIIQEIDIENWLLFKSKAIKGVQQNSNRLRIVWIQMNQDSMPWRYQIRKPTFNLILQHFHLQTAFKYLSTTVGGLSKFRVGGQKDLIHSYAAFVTGRLSLLWSYNARTGNIQGICLANPGTTRLVQELFKYQSGFLGHTMALAYLTAAALGRSLGSELGGESKAIGMIENRTGYIAGKNGAFETATGDYGSLSAQMSGCATVLAGTRKKLKCVREILQLASRLSIIERKERTSVTDEYRRLVETEILHVEALQTSRLDMIEVQLAFLEKRTEIQLTAVSPPKKLLLSFIR